VTVNDHFTRLPLVVSENFKVHIVISGQILPEQQINQSAGEK